MKTPQTPRQWPEPRTAAHCYDWISPETVISLALQAYYATSRQQDHLPDDPTGEDATFNNGRDGFAEDLAYDFRLRVDAHGHAQRIPNGRGLYYAQHELALRHGPRSDDRAPPAFFSRPHPTVRLEHDIHRALFVCRHPQV